MNQAQIDALKEIERQLQLMWAAEGPTVIDVQSNLQAAVDSAPEKVILDLGGRTFVTTLHVSKPLTIRNGAIAAPPNTNDLIVLDGEDISLLNINATGDGTTKRGVSAQGKNMYLEGCQIRNIRRVGQESQALAMWDGTQLTVKNSVLEGGSQAVLLGGNGTKVQNHVPTDILFDNVLMTRPLEWRGQGYACKTGFEVKNGRNITVKNSLIENVWTEGQTGVAITLTPSDVAGTNPLTTVDNVLFENNVIQNVAGGVSALGLSQHQALRPTTKGSGYRFLGNSWNVSKAKFVGQGALLQLGWEPDGVEFVNNVATTDGDAMIRVTDTYPVTGFKFTGNTVNKAGTYGIFASWGSRGAAFIAHFPDGVIADNTLYDANSVFKANFPNNTYKLNV